MTFYTSKPSQVEALRFEGGSNATHILSWLARHGLSTATFFDEQFAFMGSDGKKYCAVPAQLDLGLPHVKVADVGDYIIRSVGDTKELGRIRSQFNVMSDAQFKRMYDHACDTCSGDIRETVGLVCRTCGHDYSKGN